MEGQAGSGPMQKGRPEEIERSQVDEAVGSSSVASLLARLRETGWLQPIDVHFARLVTRPWGRAAHPSPAEALGASGPASPEAAGEHEDDTESQLQLVALGAAVASRYLREGHTCAPLAELAERELRLEDGSRVGTWPALGPWLDALVASPAVAAPQAERLAAEAIPLVLDEGRLALHRYFEHETRLAERWAELQGSIAVDWHPDEHEWLQTRLDHYFPPAPDGREDRQRWAAERCLKQRSLVISGGPGTGKTSTVVKILALLAEQAERHRQPAPRVRLLAPTGKAAARLSESIRAAKTKLAMPENVASVIAEEASTIHRALGTRGGMATRFLHGPERPLPADLVLVDEASMVDLALMRHLVEAVPKNARLVLLGDRHQLASVEAGSVLSELCDILAESDRMVELRRSYRFRPGSGIAALAGAVRDADVEGALDVLGDQRADLQFIAHDDGTQRQEFRNLCVEGYRQALRHDDPARVLDEFGAFRVLCAHRRGPRGVERLNQDIVRWLVDAALLPGSVGGASGVGSEYYRGRLVLVTRNDYGVGLRNGDIGLVWPDASGRLAVFFPEASGLRRLSPAHLPEHETAFALTVHKSQGSEYDRVALVCPHQTSPLATRQLLYTGITRARHHAVVVGTPGDVRVAIGRRVTRHSGLQAAWTRAES